MEDEKLNEKIYLTLKRVLMNYVTTTNERLDDLNGVSPTKLQKNFIPELKIFNPTSSMFSWIKVSLKKTSSTTI